MSLRTYQSKRDFKRTREPSGAASRPSRSRSRAPRFVIQKHDATRLHYDLRLEMDGVLKSWAVPKGLPFRRGDRRLAVQVEDHPMDYADFEGTIPADSYGGGTVMVWDRGTYSVREGENASRDYEDGKMHLTLEGTKLRGEWTIVRTRPGSGDKQQWLILKSGEDLPPITAKAEDESVLTHRTMDQIASKNEAQWTTDLRPRAGARPALRAVLNKARRQAELAADVKDQPKGRARFIEPMKCALVDKLPRGGDWLYEIKFDGVRAQAIREKDKISLMSRMGNNFTAKYPEVARAVSALSWGEGVLDGEIVALDEQGRPQFQLLQAIEKSGRERANIFYYAFDLLNLEGRDLLALPLLRRKELLAGLLAKPPEPIRISLSIDAESERVMRQMQAWGLEGLVAKRRNSRYEPGRRGGAWVKFKWTLQQEFVIGGFTRPEGTRAHFGSVIVGYYEDGKLLFASRVGSGFSEALLASLFSRFQKLSRTTCPFANLQALRPGTDVGGLSAAELRRCSWVEPRLVCEVRFTEWTQDGHLRQPVFLGLREDKSADEVVRERPQIVRP